MNIETLKLELIRWILLLQDTQLLNLQSYLQFEITFPLPAGCRLVPPLAQ